MRPPAQRFVSWFVRFLERRVGRSWLDAVPPSLRFAVLVFFLGIGMARGSEFVAPEKTLKKMESVARDLAKAGRADAALELCDSITLLGGGSERAATLTKGINADLAKFAAGKAKPKSSLPREAKLLREIGKELAANLPELDESARRVLARRILELDGNNEAAHLALGREKHESRYRPPGEEARAARRAAIRKAVADSRTLPIEVEIDESQDRFAREVCGDDVIVARAHGLEIHSTFSATKLERIVKTCLRATAVANFLVYGELAVPRLHNEPILWLPTRVEYDRAIVVARNGFRISERYRDHVEKLTGFFLDSGYGVQFDATEAGTESVLVGFLFAETYLDGARSVRVQDTQAALVAGLHEWLCRTCLGVAAPRFIWFQGDDFRHDGGGGGSQTKEDADALRIRLEMLRMARGGILGCRTYMQWRVRRGEDPPFASCLKEQTGQLEGDEPLKVALVWEYLAETVDLLALMRGVADRPIDARGNAAAEEQSDRPAQRFERELGMSLDEFDANWRDWIAPDRPGLAGELDAAPSESKFDKKQLEALAAFNALRQKAMGDDAGGEPTAATLDPSLSDGCANHANYLLKHRHQASAWPDAHEEYPDHEGFSVEGSYAGLHSVIMPGARSATDAIDGWMATFYHRVPLLVPNVVRIGFALEGDIAVLDAVSLVAPTPKEGWKIVWPPHESRDIPTRFAPELPNPVPGEDQSKWGYPVTVQRNERDGLAGTATFELFLGSKDGPKVDAYVSTPDRPTNPELAPPETYCLIPKAHLKPSTKYVVRFTPPEGGKADEWFFTTGR